MNAHPDHDHENVTPGDNGAPTEPDSPQASSGGSSSVPENAYSYDADLRPGEEAPSDLRDRDTDIIPARGDTQEQPLASSSEEADGSAAHTALRGEADPRAVLRPLPEGYPQPPAPDRPNRAPAIAQDPVQTPQRTVPVFAIVCAGLLILALLAGTGILVFSLLRGRGANSTDDPGPAPASPTDQEPGDDEDSGADDDPADSGDDSTSDPSDGGGIPPGTGTGSIAEHLDITVISAERGVSAVGDGSNRVQAEGEFIIVTMDVTYDGATMVRLGDVTTLIAADGSTYEVNTEASSEHLADTEDHVYLAPGESGQFHAVFDVPVGTEADAIDVQAPGVNGPENARVDIP